MKNKNQSLPKLSEDLILFKDKLKGEVVTFSEIIDLLEQRGPAMLLFIFALPMALPVPVPPGINIMLASPLVLLTAQLALGRNQIWIPRKLKQRGLGRGKVEKMIDVCLPWVKRLEWLVRPRLGFLTTGPARLIIGVCGLIMALTVMIPLPFTNTAPSFGIACMAVGILMRDGLAVIGGIIVGLAWIALLIIAGEAGVEALKMLIKGA